jgi:hypothetical protein
MASEMKIDFGQLYRRAFAEKDPVTKDLLLQQVQSLLDEWRQSNSKILPRPDPVCRLPDLHEFPVYQERRRA